jgi:hypothetical protein
MNGESRQKKTTWEGYSYPSYEKRLKSNWAGTSLGDAFKSSLDYPDRLPALRLFYREVQKIQKKVARLCGERESDFQPKVKPQLGPCYTTYPATPAAVAAIGQTAFLEYEARVPQKSLVADLKEYLENPGAFDEVEADPDIYRKLCKTVAELVHKRLLLEDLVRTESLKAVEAYRLFSASQQSLQFRYLPEILRAVILFGDLLPDWRDLELHPFTRILLQELYDLSAPFLVKIGHSRGPQMLSLGSSWVRVVCRGLAVYLPSPATADPDSIGGSSADTGKKFNPTGYRFHRNFLGFIESGDFAPLEGLQAPALFETATAKDAFINAAFKALEPHQSGGKAQPEADPLIEEFKKTLNRFSEALTQAGGQDRQWEDMRSDLVEKSLAASPFEGGLIEGHPADGHEVTVSLGGEAAGGEIYDRPVEPAHDPAACEDLLKAAQPITEALRRNLYPSVDQIPETQRLRTSGSIDPARLALAGFSSTIYRRYRLEERADPRGRPVLVVACDGSGSLNQNQMKMVKILCAAEANSTARTQIQFLAALYHSGQIRKGLSGPLVQWLYHPEKTPAASRLDAVRALVSLPASGTGAQSDALSLAFILEEAGRLARGDMIYLIVLSDTAWNRSFRTDRDGRQEVQELFRGLYESKSHKLHTTLVALGVSEETGFEDLLDRVITVSGPELENYGAVAEKIGLYVASCIKERSRLVAKR